MGHRRNKKELDGDFQRFVGDMAEHKPSDKAKKFFEHKPYTNLREEKDNGNQHGR